MLWITRTVSAGLMAVVALAALEQVSAAPIQPDSVAGLALWLKADDITPGAEPANGAAVTTWQDHSANGYHATLPTDLPASPFESPERQEVTIAVPGGTHAFPVVRFNTSDDELLRAADIILGPDSDNEAAEGANFGEVTVIAVYQTASITSDNRPFGFGTSYNDNRGGVNGNNFHLATDPSIRKDNGAVTGYTASHPTEYLIRSATMSVSDGSVEEFFGGTPVLSSTATYSIRSDNFYVGDMRIPTGQDFDIAEVIVYNNALGTADRHGIEEYLAQKYLPDLSPRAISVDFNRGEGNINGGLDMAPIEIAGIEPRRYWNQGRSADALGTTGDPPVIDSRGNVLSGVEITWNTAGSGSTNNANAGGTTANERMMHDYAARNPEGEDLEVIVTGLPGEYTSLGYDVILYQDSISSKSGQHTFNLDWGNDGSVDDVLVLADTGATNYVDTGDPASDFAGFHVRFTVPRGIQDFKLTITGDVQMELNGMQIVQNIPEPSGLLLAALGLSALVIGARRRARRSPVKTSCLLPGKTDSR